jgi:hypothetical protein
VKQEIQNRANSKQTLVSLVVLATLAVVAGGVLMAQFDFYPAVHQRVSNLQTADQQEPTLPVSSESSLISLPAGQSPISPAEFFDATTLSDKINGKAELYLSAGFIRLHSQRLNADGAGDVWMETFVYEMQTPENAFSVFSAQRRSNAQKLDMTQYAYQTPNALFFVHGPFYVEIVASDTSEAIKQPMRTLAEAFIKSQPFKTQEIDEKSLFPVEGLMEDSVSLVSVDAFGYEGFDRIFTAAYQLDNTELMAFFSRRSSAQEAQALASGYADFLLAFGGTIAESDPAIPASRTIFILDTYEVIFSLGPYLIGVREATEKQTAQVLALQLSDKFKKVAHE